MLMRLERRGVMAAWLVAVVVASGTGEARAQAYPTKPVEIVVPFVAGGGTDLIARVTAERLGKKWGQPLLVVNKPGGGGVIGARAALKEAKADGYTVLMDIHTTGPMMIGAWKTPPLTMADRKYAGRIVLDPMVWVVKADASWKSLRELSDWVKANPTELVWGSVGPSGPSRYTAYDWFGQIGVEAAKTKMVITEGAADSLAKVAGGHLVLAIHSVAEAHALTEAGKVKVLGVLAPQRIRFLPSVPTAEEQGVMKGVSVSWWAGISLPAATPDAIVKTWEGAVAEMVKDPQFVAATDRLRMNVDHLNAADMTAFVEKQAAYYTEMAARIGLRK